jgi:glucose/mannose-6-phosphate isomerase
LDLSQLEKYDSQKMYKVYDEWHKIANDAYNSELETVNFEKIEHIVFAGMGGSGAIGDLFSSVLSKTDIHVNVVKGYLLPRTVNSNTLVVVTSVSGNTVETLKILESAKNIGCKIIAFSSGGKILSFCNENNIEFRLISKIHSPRASFVRYTYSIIKVLQNVIPIDANDVLESISELKNLSNLICSSNLNDTNPSLELSLWLDQIPVIYYPWGLHAAAIRFKSSLQENSKMHAMIEDIIETSHNGIVAWEKKHPVKPILIEGIDDYIKTKERWIIIKEYFEENSMDFREIFSVNGSILSKIINLIYLLDYASIYKAVLSETDPSPIHSIDFIKKRL